MNEEGEGCKSQNHLYESHAYCPTTLFLWRNGGQPKMLGVAVLVIQTCYSQVSGVSNDSNGRHTIQAAFCCQNRT